MSGHEAAKAMRETGWSVAIHNDYRLNGERMTFWLWTHPNGRWVKGEGETDEVALGECLRAIPAQPPAATTLAASDFTEPGPVVAESAAAYPRDAVRDVLAERERQQSVEGWTPEHDDKHVNGEMAKAAAAYATGARLGIPLVWPWGDDWWKPKDRRRDLVRAGALILAEIERLDRLAAIDAIGAKP